MKEIGMEKFNAEKHIENLGKTDKEMGKLKGLLEEYNKHITNWNENIIARVVLSSLVSGGWCFTNEGELVVISKDYGFIKWLVENDKIDYKKLREGREDLCDVNLRHLRNKYIDVGSLSYIKLLMLLAISDTPIEDLISYLK